VKKQNQSLIIVLMVHRWNLKEHRYTEFTENTDWFFGFYFKILFIHVLLFFVIFIQDEIILTTEILFTTFLVLKMKRWITAW